MGYSQGQAWLKGLKSLATVYFLSALVLYGSWVGPSAGQEPLSQVSHGRGDT